MPEARRRIVRAAERRKSHPKLTNKTTQDPANAGSEAADRQSRRAEKESGARRNRTVDLLGFNQALSHLSYRTKKWLDRMAITSRHES